MVIDAIGLEYTSESFHSREDWIDIVKGILICCVVLGHLRLSYSGFFNWFHMSLFFVIAGYVTKFPKNNRTKPWILRKAKRLLIPYWVYTIFAWICMGEFTLRSFLRTIIINLYGGRLTNTFTVNWYITCLFLSYLILLCIEKEIKNSKTKLLILLVMALFGIIESYLLIILGGGYRPNSEFLYSMEC